MAWISLPWYRPRVYLPTSKVYVCMCVCVYVWVCVCVCVCKRPRGTGYGRECVSVCASAVAIVATNRPSASQNTTRRGRPSFLYSRDTSSRARAYDINAGTARDRLQYYLYDLNNNRTPIPPTTSPGYVRGRPFVFIRPIFRPISVRLVNENLQ